MSPVRISNVDAPSVVRAGTNKPGAAAGGPARFGQVLTSELEKRSDIKISTHAQKRLDERNVQMDGNDQARLSAAMNKVQEKGADKSLVLLDNLALIVSAKNRVVITALDSANAKDGVFTGIDSAVIA